MPQSLPGHFSAIRGELLNTGLVENAALTWNEPLRMNSSSGEYTWEGKSPGTAVQVYDMGVSPEYISTMHMTIKSGRDFYPQPGIDSNKIIINDNHGEINGRRGKDRILYFQEVFFNKGTDNWDNRGFCF